MNLKTSPFAIQDKKLRDLDLAKEYPTLKDLMKEQGVSTGIHTDYLNDAAYGLGEDTQQADELWDAVGFNPDEEPKP